MKLSPRSRKVFIQTDNDSPPKKLQERQSIQQKLFALMEESSEESQEIDSKGEEEKTTEITKND